MHYRLWQVDSLRNAFISSGQLIFWPEICELFILLFSPFYTILRTYCITWQNTVSKPNGTEQVGLAVMLQAYVQETTVYILSRDQPRGLVVSLSDY